MIFARAARHLSDGELLRLMDADAPGHELARFDAHAAACPRCATGLRSLRHAAAVVHQRLQEMPVPAAEYAPGLLAPAFAAGHGAPGSYAPAATPLWSRGWARAAVLLLALAGALVTVQPLRARIRGWVAAAWAGLAGPAPARVAAPAPHAAPTSAAAAPFRLSFTPAGSELRLLLASRQAAGTLTLARASGTSASLEIVRGDVGVVPLASERLLEIRNGPGARGSYVVRIPPRVRVVVVTVGREAPRSFAAAALDAGVRLELGPAEGHP